MAKVVENISPELREWIEAQHLFFVASAPLEGGHVNVSPKGMDCLRVLSPLQAAYLDLTGSGNETSAHLLDNGRLTLMFCAFEGAPRILRLYGAGRTILPGTPEWDDLAPKFTLYAGTRQIILIDVERVQTSCGFGVPFFKYVGEREALTKWAESKGEEGMIAYRHEKNMQSIDALPTPLAEQTELRER